jgi:hypothetical protein
VLTIVVVLLVAAGLVAVAVRDAGDRAGDRAGGGAVVGTPPTGAGTDPATPPPTPPPTGPATPPAPTTTVAEVPERYRQAFRDLQDQVAALRGLAWKAPLNLRVVPRAQLAQEVRRVLERDADPEKEAADEATLKILGLIPRDLDYPALIEDLLAEQVLGFYDPDTKELFVGGGDESGRLDPHTRFVIAHEMVHALTDQHFDFGARMEALEDADRFDELAAMSALIEGDATVSQYAWADANLSETEALAALFGGGGGSDVFSRTPQYIRRALLFPYQAGEEFVTRLHRQGGFAAVDGAYRDPPVSTEQILHPELYPVATPAPPPPLPDLAAATGCRALRTSALGEFDTGEVLDQHLGNDESAAAAAGWNGDAYTVLRCGTALALVNRWQGDAGSDATELSAALARWARPWSGSPTAPGADGRFSGPRGAGRVVRTGPVVELVLADDIGTLQRVLAALGG